MKILVARGVAAEMAGGYRLHNVTHEYLLLYTKITPDAISTVISRQARFLVAARTVQGFTNAGADDIGGLHSLVKLLATIKELDPKRTMDDEVLGLEEASTDKAYMRDAGNLMFVTVRKN